MSAKVQVDSLVRGRFGNSPDEGTMRVFRVLSWGVAGITEDGKQRTMYDFEVVEPPRPIHARRDIPSRLQ